MDLSVVILAAGKGSRMRSSLPKVLHPMGGKSMLSHVVSVAKSLSPKRIIVVYGEHKELMMSHVADDGIEWVQQAQQKGTGDAVATAMELIEDNHRVLTLYGDVPLIGTETLRRLVRVTPEDAVGFLTAQVEDPTGLGRVLRGQNNEVVAIREEKDADDEQLQIHEVNTGIFLLSAKHLKTWLPKLNNKNAQGEYYLTDIIELAKNDIVGIHTAQPSVVNEVLGVNNQTQLVAAERYFQKRLAHQFLENGVLILDPNRFDLRGSLSAGVDVTIDVNVIFEGNVSLGDRVKVGGHCQIKNCRIGNDVQILSHCHLEDVIIHNGAVVGPFARLRPGTELGPDSRVGNFVEIKKSIVGAGSKVNHLTYVGDAFIGKKVNIGAGTITCNYDGANKHKTIIKDGAHIGSNCQLVAPVTVEVGATLGAGSTLVKDAPPNKLTLTHRLEQRSLDWVKPEKIEKHSAKIVEQSRG